MQLGATLAGRRLHNKPRIEGFFETSDIGTFKAFESSKSLETTIYSAQTEEVVHLQNRILDSHKIIQ